MSVTGFPAIELKKEEKGPFTEDKKPRVGDPPFNHEFSGRVENPKPNSLSKKAQRNMNPREMRSRARMYWLFMADYNLRNL